MILGKYYGLDYVNSFFSFQLSIMFFWILFSCILQKIYFQLCLSTSVDFILSFFSLEFVFYLDSNKQLKLLHIWSFAKVDTFLRLWNLNNIKNC